MFSFAFPGCYSLILKINKCLWKEGFLGVEWGNAVDKTSYTGHTDV